MMLRFRDKSKSVRRSARILIAAAVLALCLPAAGGLAESIGLTILHTNDTHGHLLPFSYPEMVPRGSALAQLSKRHDIGGIARRAALAGTIRAQLQKRGTTVWLVDAGDFSDGTPFSIEYHGEADVAAMNAAGYNFGALGNNEFSRSLDQTRKLIDLAEFPMLCANAVLKDGGRPLAKPYVIQNIGPLRVALFGLLTREARAYPAARQGVIVSDPLESAQRMAERLKTHADILIVLSHCGDEVDRRIAERIDEIDVIVGGHSHSRLPSGRFVWHGEELKANDVEGTILVQNHQWGGELGRLDLLFSQDDEGRWHVDRYRARLLPVTGEGAEDPAVAAVVDRFWKPLAARYGEIIGQAVGDFVTLEDDMAEYNLMADAIRTTFKTDFVLENIGGIRSPLVQGPITRGDLVAMDPFGNTIVTFKLDGRTLKRLLRTETPAVSGIRYRIEDHVLAEAYCAGRPLVDDRIYTGATNSFFARNWLKEIPVQDPGRRRLDVLAEYIRGRGRIAPVHDGRRTVR